MNALLKISTFLVCVSLLVSGCAALPSPVETEEGRMPKNAAYKSMLGKPLADEEVAEFILKNDCSSADQFLLCASAGMALWTDSNKVEIIYLYLNDAGGFEPYKGQLPFGLKYYDNMAAVEYKLNRQGFGNAGLPDTVAIPDHMHYRATYHEAGLTILYNAPFPDEDASIHAILLSRQAAVLQDQP